MLESIRAFAEDELSVPVRAATVESTSGATLPDIMAWAKTYRSEAVVGVIAMGNPTNQSPAHLFFDTNTLIAAINVPALRHDDPDIFSKRLVRQTMRAAAFILGLAPCPDPFCVTRPYTSLEDLDRMGLNFSPPWKDEFVKRAKEHSLEIIRRVPPAVRMKREARNLPSSQPPGKKTNP